MAPRRIIDADGDGVEDNRKVSRHWLDKIQADVYGYNIDDIHNTQNGEIAGHERYGDFPEPKNHWTTPFDERPKDTGAVQFESINGVDDLANNYYDDEMIQTTLSNYVNIINSPEDLELIGFSSEYRKFKPREIYDIDGDGVEDNMKLTSAQLDPFYKPNVFGAEIQYIYNTRHGNLPGERNKWFYDMQSEYPNTYDVVKKDWNRLGDKV